MDNFVAFPDYSHMYNLSLFIIEKGQITRFSFIHKTHSSSNAHLFACISWQPDPNHVFATHGIGNAVGLTLQSLTEPGDGIIVFSPVYHEFYNKIRNNGRVLVESPLVIDDDTVIRIKVSGREDHHLVSLDSRIASIENGQELTVRKAGFKIKMVEYTSESFLKTIRNKLLWGEDRRN